MINLITKADALATLRPNSNFVIYDNEIDWQDLNQTCPT